jgi:hypothetical protein
MPDSDHYANIYLNFPDNQQWLADTLADMTHEEYLGFVDYVFAELGFAAEAKEGSEFQRIASLILALARKELEIGHFMAGLSDEYRESCIKCAKSFYEMAKKFCSQDMLLPIETAWAASLDHAALYGWPSTIFLTIEGSHRVFRDDSS